jgi:mannose-1-phosphate guanylyltransferase / mannose-6-phosphate isomerase
MDLVEKLKNYKLHPFPAVEENFEKPWGGYRTFFRNEKGLTFKELYVINELSVQSHTQRDEHWILEHGSAELYLGPIMPTYEETIAALTPVIAEPHQSIFIPRGTVHTAVLTAGEIAIFRELAFGNAQEDDIVRYYDMHGRVELAGYRGIPLKELIPLLRKQ